MSPSPLDPTPASFDRARRPPSVFALMFSRRIVWPALKVSLVVGTVLNVVNNGQQFWTHHTLSLWQVALNFVVPFCVSSYSAARNEARGAREG